MKTLLTGNVLWSYDYEVLHRGMADNARAHFSEFKPFHRHEGQIALTTEGILINGDENIQIPLGSLDQIYLGFDEIFPRTFVKNMGLFWEPLRIVFSGEQKIYLIIDYTFFGTKNRFWFETLQQTLPGE